jgi:chemotaxis protein MotB
MNNWLLSTARAESTRATLHGSGIPISRFARIEGVAERDPYVPEDRYDPRNRRISITLGWRGGETPPAVPRQLASRN